MTICSINQPAYLPWLGAFDRIMKSDVHVCLNHVTMGKDAVTNRNKILTPTGAQLLTVPIRDRGGCTPIIDIEIADDKWRRKHLSALQNNYARAPYFKSRFGWFESIYEHEWANLHPLITMTSQIFMDEWGISTPIVFSSDLDARGTKSDLNLNICLEVGATTYLSGPFGRAYLDIVKFNLHGIDVVFQDYVHPIYSQSWPGEFVSHLSAIDALFNCKDFPT